MHTIKRRAILSGAGLLVAWSLLGSTIHASLPERPIEFSALRGEFPPVAVIVQGSRGCYNIDTLLAATPAQRARGLMFVRSMPPDAGMLFVYPEQRQMSMWMKNTLIPLDILFADSDGTVINIAADTTPLSLQSISSGGLATYVLELNSGVAARLGISRGGQLYIYPSGR